MGLPRQPGGKHAVHVRSGAALQAADAEKILMYDEALRGRQNEKAVTLGNEAGGAYTQEVLPPHPTPSRSSRRSRTPDPSTTISHPPRPSYTRRNSRLRNFLPQAGSKSRVSSAGRDKLWSSRARTPSALSRRQTYLDKKFKHTHTREQWLHAVTKSKTTLMLEGPDLATPVHPAHLHHTTPSSGGSESHPKPVRLRHTIATRSSVFPAKV